MKNEIRSFVRRSVPLSLLLFAMAGTLTVSGKGNREIPDHRSESLASVSSAQRIATTRCNPEKEVRIDMSGTYSGNINYPDAGLSGEALLTITGNRFTLKAGTKSETGTITAVRTCGYTAVAMMFGQWKMPQPGEPVLPPLPMLSLRAVKKGGQLALIPSPSETRAFSFASSAKK